MLRAVQIHKTTNLRTHRTWISRTRTIRVEVLSGAGRETMYFKSATTYCLFGLLQSAICLLDAHAAGPQAEWASPQIPQGAFIMTPEGKEIFQVEFSCGPLQPNASVTIYGGDRYHGSVLKRVETELPFILEVQRASGGSAKFPVIFTIPLLTGVRGSAGGRERAG